MEHGPFIDEFPITTSTRTISIAMFDWRVTTPKWRTDIRCIPVTPINGEKTYRWEEAKCEDENINRYEYENQTCVL